MDLTEENYPGGFYRLMRRLERKETPFIEPHAALPPADCDLAALWDATVPARPEPAGVQEGHVLAKLASIREEFAGQPEVLPLHAICIAILRRRDPPPEAQALFLRIWGEHGGRMAEVLPMRWLISAATTFGDHGATVEQRLGGQGLSMLFDLIKLHDSERRLSGRSNRDGFPWQASRELPPLGLGLTPYMLAGGDLDMNMLARLWRLAESDPVFAPLGMRMLRKVMSDPQTIFGRIQRYKGRSRKV
ncbi:hypothetical protein [Cribrihabitans neustonicus]|uniref:hypothetical protein n=1 Tax=Cribrihabitans neustonicus TaxID=1429085 RepID=UPI003B5BA4A2